MSSADVAVPFLDLRPQHAALKAEILAAWSRALDETAFCLGPEVDALEREFAEMCGVEHGVGASSGTAALHLALRALGVGAGDEVVTTPFTFIATAWAVSYCGATPVFADIDRETFTIDPRAVARAITPRTKAIVAVHLFGQPCDMAALEDVARRAGVPLVEDAAQAHGARVGDRVVGSLGAIGCFSFYPSKNLGACGEGGLCVTRDRSLAEKMRSLRNHASPRKYHHDEIGFNYRMENLQAAALRVKLPRLATWNERRRAIAASYDRLLDGATVRTPRVARDRTHVYHLYVVRHAERDRLAAHLAERGIGTSLHYPLPLHRQRAYAHLGLGAGAFPEAEAAARECLSLPLYPELTDEQAARVAAAVRSFA